MNLLLFTTLSVITDKVYVILGGTSASNSNNYNYTEINPRVYSFNNYTWDIATSPMPGGNGEGGSPWAELGNKLQHFYNDSIYFVDCARINASLLDWGPGGKYRNFSQNCLNIAEKKNQNYNVLWQEGPQDNRYSVYSNQFLDTLNGLKMGKTWYVSIYTYPNYSQLRWYKLQDIYILTTQYTNYYLGANIDELCSNELPFNQSQTSKLSDLWFDSIVNNRTSYFINGLFVDCGDTIFNLQNLILVVCFVTITLFLSIGCYYCIRFHQRRREYESLTST